MLDRSQEHDAAKPVAATDSACRNRPRLGDDATEGREHRPGPSVSAGFHALSDDSHFKMNAAGLFNIARITQSPSHPLT
jgi:hypothetical protein